MKQVRFSLGILNLLCGRFCPGLWFYNKLNKVVWLNMQESDARGFYISATRTSVSQR
jgi:hypothetical protein